MTNPHTESDLSRLVVVTPHPQHLHHAYVLHHLIDQPVLDVDASGAGSAQIAHQGFVGRWLLIRISSQQIKQGLGLLLQGRRRGGEFAGILLGLFGKQNGPAHQPGSVLSSEASVAIPSRIDSRIPGMANRWSVSSIERQSASEIRTAFPLFPWICTG